VGCVGVLSKRGQRRGLAGDCSRETGRGMEMRMILKQTAPDGSVATDRETEKPPVCEALPVRRWHADANAEHVYQARPTFRAPSKKKKGKGGLKHGDFDQSAILVGCSRQPARCSRGMSLGLAVRGQGNRTQQCDPPGSLFS